jgi:hypothetical protein
MDELSKAASKGGGKDGGGGAPLLLNSGIFNSGIFNNGSFGSFSNLQDLPFFESLASLGDLSSLGAAFHQSIPSIPEHLAAVAAAHAAATAAAGQQGSSSSLNLGRNDSFANFTQSSLHNLQLFLSEVEQGVIASGQVQQQQQQQQQAQQQQQQVQQQSSPQLMQQQHQHQSQQAQPLPPAAAATYAPIKAASPAPHHHHHTLQPLKAGPAPTPIALTPIYPSPAQFAAFAPSMHSYPHHLQQQQQQQLQPQHSTQQWGPRPGGFGGNAQSSPKMPLAPMMSAQGGPPSLAPIGGSPSMGVAVPQEFSSTLYSLASTLPPPMILSNDSVLGSVGGGLHFQRHCVRRRTPDELAQSDPSMFLN